MQHFDRSADPQGIGRIDIEQRRGVQDQKGAQPFSGGENGISHRFMNAAMETMGLGQNPFQQSVNIARRIRHRLP